MWRAFGVDVTVGILIVVALVIGLGLGWFLGGRGSTPLQAELAALRDRLSTAERDGAAHAERASRADQLQKLLDAVTGERDDALRGRAALEADARNFDARLKDLTESKDALVRQMREVGDQLLEKAQKDFLARAGERFSEADKTSQAKLQNLLQPVEATLKRYEEGLQRVEKERVDQYAGLREAVDLVRAGQGQVRDETRNLVNALRSSPKARGRWGEQSLKNVLEQAGLTPHADFRTEVSVDTDDGRLRPDVIVNLPGGRKLVSDAKCSLNAFLDASEEVDDDRRSAHLRAHVVSIRNHAQQLGSKNYWSQFGDAADYVVMYIPGEHFLTAALELDDALWEWAFERKVLLATPTNLVAIARTVASVWKQEKLAEAADEIASLGKELHSRLATMAQHMERVGKNLSTANAAYNQMVGSFESQVFTQARRFEGLGAGSAKEMPAPPMVEAAPRPLTKLAPPSSANEDAA
jgi:DNA recombination protein RmuC